MDRSSRSSRKESLDLEKQGRLSTSRQSASQRRFLLKDGEVEFDEEREQQDLEADADGTSNEACRLFKEVAGIVRQEVRRLLHHAQTKAAFAEEGAVEKEVNCAVENCLDKLGNYVDYAVQLLQGTDAERAEDNEEQKPRFSAVHFPKESVVVDIMQKQLQTAVVDLKQKDAELQRMDERLTQGDQLFRKMRRTYYCDLSYRKNRNRQLLKRCMGSFSQEELDEYGFDAKGEATFFTIEPFLEDETREMVQLKEQEMREEFDLEREQLMKTTKEAKERMSQAEKRVSTLQNELRKLRVQAKFLNMGKTKQAGPDNAESDDLHAEQHFHDDEEEEEVHAIARRRNSSHADHDGSMGLDRLKDSRRQLQKTCEQQKLLLLDMQVRSKKQVELLDSQLQWIKSEERHDKDNKKLSEFDGARWAALTKMFSDVHTRSEECDKLLQQANTDDGVQADKEVLRQVLLNEELSNKASMVEVENTMVKGKLADVIHELEGLHDDVSLLKDENHEVSEKCDELEKRNRELEEEIDKFGQERSTFEYQIKELNEKFQNQTHELSEEREERQRTESQLEELMGKLEEAKEEAERIEAENQDLKEKASEAEGRAVRMVMQARKLEQDHTESETISVGLPRQSMHIRSTDPRPTCKSTWVVRGIQDGSGDVVQIETADAECQADASFYIVSGRRDEGKHGPITEDVGTETPQEWWTGNRGHRGAGVDSEQLQKLGIAVRGDMVDMECQTDFKIQVVPDEPPVSLNKFRMAKQPNMDMMAMGDDMIPEDDMFTDDFGMRMTRSDGFTSAGSPMSRLDTAQTYDTMPSSAAAESSQQDDEPVTSSKPRPTSNAASGFLAMQKVLTMQKVALGGRRPMSGMNPDNTLAEIPDQEIDTSMQSTRSHFSAPLDGTSTNIGKAWARREQLLQVEQQRAVWEATRNAKRALYRAWPRVSSVPLHAVRHSHLPTPTIPTDTFAVIDDARATKSVPLKRGGAPWAPQKNPFQGERPEFSRTTDELGLTQAEEEALAERNQALKRLDHARFLSYSQACHVLACDVDIRHEPSLDDHLQSELLFKHYRVLDNIYRGIKDSATHWKDNMSTLQIRLGGSALESAGCQAELSAMKDNFSSMIYQGFLAWEAQRRELKRCNRAMKKLDIPLAARPVLLNSKPDIEALTELVEDQYPGLLPTIELKAAQAIAAAREEMFHRAQTAKEALLPYWATGAYSPFSGGPVELPDMPVDEDDPDAHLKNKEMIERWDKLLSAKPFQKVGVDDSLSALSGGEESKPRNPPPVTSALSDALSPRNTEETSIEGADGSDSKKSVPNEDLTDSNRFHSGGAAVVADGEEGQADAPRDLPDSFLPKPVEEKSIALLQPDRNDVVGRLVRGLAQNVEACDEWFKAQRESGELLDGETRERAAEVLDWIERVQARWSSACEKGADDHSSGGSSDEMPDFDANSKPRLSKRASRMLEDINKEEEQSAFTKGFEQGFKDAKKETTDEGRFGFVDMGEEGMCKDQLTIAQSQLLVPLSGGQLFDVMNKGALDLAEARLVSVCCSKVRELILAFLGKDHGASSIQQILACTTAQLWGSKTMKLAPPGGNVSTRLSAVLMGAEAVKALARLQTQHETAVKQKNVKVAKLQKAKEVSAGQRLAERAARRAQYQKTASNQKIEVSTEDSRFFGTASVVPGKADPGAKSLGNGKLTCVMSPKGKAKTKMAAAVRARMTAGGAFAKELDASQATASYASGDSGPKPQENVSGPTTGELSSPKNARKNARDILEDGLRNQRLEMESPSPGSPKGRVRGLEEVGSKTEPIQNMAQNIKGHLRDRLNRAVLSKSKTKEGESRERKFTEDSDSSSSAQVTGDQTWDQLQKNLASQDEGSDEEEEVDAPKSRAASQDVDARDAPNLSKPKSPSSSKSKMRSFDKSRSLEFEADEASAGSATDSTLAVSIPIPATHDRGDFFEEPGLVYQEDEDLELRSLKDLRAIAKAEGMSAEERDGAMDADDPAEALREWLAARHASSSTASSMKKKKDRSSKKKDRITIAKHLEEKMQELSGQIETGARTSAGEKTEELSGSQLEELMKYVQEIEETFDDEDDEEMQRILDDLVSGPQRPHLDEEEDGEEFSLYEADPDAPAEVATAAAVQEQDPKENKAQASPNVGKLQQSKREKQPSQPSGIQVEARNEKEESKAKGRMQKEKAKDLEKKLRSKIEKITSSKDNTSGVIEKKLTSSKDNKGTRGRFAGMVDKIKQERPKVITHEVGIQTKPDDKTIMKTQMCQTEQPAVAHLEETRRKVYKKKASRVFKDPSNKKLGMSRKGTDGSDNEDGEEKRDSINFGMASSKQKKIHIRGDTLADCSDSMKKVVSGRLVHLDTLENYSGSDDSASEEEEDPPLFPGMMVRITHPDERLNDKCAETLEFDDEKDEWTIKMNDGSTRKLHQNHLCPVPEDELTDEQRRQKEESRKSRRELRKTERKTKRANKSIASNEDPKPEEQGDDGFIKPSRPSMAGVKPNAAYPANPLKKKKRKRRAHGSMGFLKSLKTKENLEEDDEDDEHNVLEGNDEDEEPNVLEGADDEVASSSSKRITGLQMDLNFAKVDSEGIQEETRKLGVSKEKPTKIETDHSLELKSIQQQGRKMLLQRFESETESEGDDDDEPVEVIDCAQQSELVWDAMPDAVVSWLKLNLMQRQQAELYCAPWEVTELAVFPHLCKPANRLKFIKDFEDFLFDIMRLGRPTKHQVRKNLRERYRSVGAVHGLDNSHESGAEEPAPEPGALRSPDGMDLDSLLQVTAARANQEIALPLVTQSGNLCRDRAACATLVPETPGWNGTEMYVDGEAVLKGVDAALGFHVPSKPFDCDLNQDPYLLDYAAAEGLEIPDEGLSGEEKELVEASTSPKASPQQSPRDFPSQPTAPAPRPSAPVPSKKRKFKAKASESSKSMARDLAENFDLMPTKEVQPHVIASEFAAATPGGAPPSNFFPEPGMHRSDAEVRRQKMMMQTQMAAIRRHNLPLPQQDVENWLAQVNVVDQGIQSLMHIAQAVPNRDELMNCLTTVKSWLDQQPRDDHPEAGDSIHVQKPPKHKFLQSKQNQKEDLVPSEEIEEKEEKEEPAPQRQLEQRSRQSTAQERSRQSTAQKQETVAQKLENDTHWGKMNVLKGMGEDLRDDIGPLGVKYPAHGGYQIGKRPSDAPQQCYLGAVAWSYGTNSESKQVKEYVPPPTGSSRPPASRESWSRQKEKDMMRALKPIVAGSSKPVAESPFVEDLKGAKGGDALPKLQVPNNASSSGRHVKSLGSSGNFGQLRAGGSSSARGPNKSSLTTPVLSTSGALPTLPNVAPKTAR